jgi:hypothetical protein
MATKFRIRWYQKSPFVRNAFLFNCRDNDLLIESKSSIEPGHIVQGAVGYVVAEHKVPGFRANVVHWRPNRKCRWLGADWPCMAHPGIPNGKITKVSLRHYQYAVVQLPDGEAARSAVGKKVPVIVSSAGVYFVNAELSTFQRQGKANPRRAKLI